MSKDSTKKRWYEKNILAGVFVDLDLSPLRYPDDALGPKGPRLPSPFPPEGWIGEIGAFARGEKSSKVFASAEEKQVKQDRKELQDAMKAGDPLERSVAMARTLNAQLGSRYQGKVVKRDKGLKQHPDEARIQRAAISLESLLAAGKEFKEPADRKALLLAVNALNPEQQTDLLRADELSGRRLYSKLYLATQDKPGDQDDPNNQNDLKQTFAQVKGVAQLARVQGKLDAHDPSGETSALVSGTLRHLDQAGVPDQDQNALVDKLAFKLILAGSQGQFADLPLPNTAKPGWREKFTARTLSTLAEIPSVPDESLEKALDMPEADLLKVLGHTFLGANDIVANKNTDLMRREGDVRLARVACNQALDKGNVEMHALLEGLENNYLDRRRMMEETQKGTAAKDILQVLEKEAATRAGELAQQGAAKRTKRLEQVTAMVADAEEKLKDDKLPQSEKDKIAKEKKTLEQIETDLKNFTPPTAKTTLALMKRFGSFPVTDALGYSENLLAPSVLTLAPMTEKFKQIEIHAKAMEDPKVLAEGLKKSSFVLPTAGKSLKNCLWLDTTAAELVRLANAIREVDPQFTLKQNPIIVLDQSDGNGSDAAKKKLWDENDACTKKLAAAHKDVGLTIRHVSMGNINQMIKGSGLEKLFDTTGEGNAGYGGSRNMAFLLGPVIQQMVRNGEDPAALKPDELAKKIKECAMSKDAPKLLMGDDTDNVSPGTVFAKLALGASAEHKDEYSLMATTRCGRDTQGVSSMRPNTAVNDLKKNGLEGFTNNLFGANKWNDNNKPAGMGCTYGGPRFCLDLPTGAEEKQCTSSVATVDYFSQASHLSGDRQTSPSAFLKSYMAYGNMTDTVMALFNVGNLPWNAEAEQRKKGGVAPFDSLGEVMKQGADPAKRAGMQKNVLKNLVKWQEAGAGPLQLDGDQAKDVQEYIDEANKKPPGLDAETLEELGKIKGVYEDGKRQAQLLKQFTTSLLGKLKLPAKSDANNLDTSIDDALKDPAAVQKAIAEVRDEMTVELAKEKRGFNSSTPMLRDLALVLESVGGGFSDLCGKLTK